MFLKRKNHWPNNAYVDEPGFTELYVRDTERFILGVKVRTLDIARVVASRPGSGAFTKLVHRLHPDHNLFVESVIDEKFKNLLIYLGFILVHDHDSVFPCYFLLMDGLLPPQERDKGNHEQSKVGWNG